ncbi:MBL fold metallo-hydrolase [Paenibacillaceae bacterium WGS1546]|uniref:MBL fold metallo-hydrolase n=1 Tax=Cohnella sp. WGS1546 TaxID=3366810 RepID=UPI00372D7FAB
MWNAVYVVAVVAIAAFLIINLYPPLGGRASSESRRRIEQSPHSRNRKFVNQIPTSMNMDLRTSLKVFADMLKGHPQGRPAAPLETEKLSVERLNADDAPALTWFGHSAVLLRLDGKTIFLDPMLGQAPSPIPVIGGRRYSQKLPIEADQLPELDAVVISHDHYDHLDYGSIKKLRGKTRRFIVPLGVAAHLERWGIDPSRITEHDWWDELSLEGLSLACTPARHFSGRNVGSNRNSTLWCSWVVSGKQAKVFFSGDSGYGPHFKEIGDKYGPFDVTLMECGQYDERWSGIHMLPEETVQAHIDVRGRTMIPIHWGAFTLALHGWTDPVERAAKAAGERGVVVATPRIGELVRIGGQEVPSASWWRTVLT